MTTVAGSPAPADAGRGLLIDIRALAELLCRSVASLERDQAAGRLPSPVYVGGSRRWRRAEVEAWVAAGCPGRTQWEEMRVAPAPPMCPQPGEPRTQAEERT